MQLLLGRAETRVKISEIRRCWTAVSLDGVLVLWFATKKDRAGGSSGGAYKLGVEFGQPGLAIVVED